MTDDARTEDAENVPAEAPEQSEETPPAADVSAEVQAITDGYTFSEEAIELGVLMNGEEPEPSA